jgi:hypothetical protein
MMRLHHWFRVAPVLLLLLLPTAPARGQGGDKWLEDRALTVSPSKLPVPLFRYRLLPLATDLKPGDAAPIYLRFAHERSDETKKKLVEKPQEWNKLPLDKIPIKEAKEFLAGHAYNLNQLDLGARRQECDWNYTLDIDDLVGIHLSDVQEMRMYMQLLVLKARVEIATGDYAAAMRTLETGFAFSRHVAEAPLLINGLVGLAGVSMMTTCVFEMAERPDAPSLYWAATALPRPLIDLRRAMEFDQRFGVMQFGLREIDRDRSPEGWAAALKRVRDEMRRLSQPQNPGGPKEDPPLDDEKEQAFARKFLTERVGLPEAKVKAMAKEQAILTAAAAQYRQIADDTFAGAYLPFPEGQPYLEAAEKRLKDLPDTQGTRLVRMMLPAITRVQVALARTERRTAALRLVEALRLHAAETGKLPERLDQVKVVPVPKDPATGKAFEYKLDGDTATITSLIPGEPAEKGALRLKVTLRK